MFDRIKNSFFEQAQRFGKSLMLPIAVLPAAGLLLGIGGALSNPNTLLAYPFLDVWLIQAIFILMASAGSVIFGNLPILFAVGLAVGLARSDKGTAGLAALLGYFVMNATINAMLLLNNELLTENLGNAGQGLILGMQVLDTGVFGGVIVGLMTYGLHQRFNKIELPQILGFFGGSRFVPIITSFSAILLGVVMYIVWPVVQSGIGSLGGLVDASGYIGTFIYGFVLRLLGPFGLHHIFYLPFWQTALGGSLVVDGVLVDGAQRIFFAQLADPNTQQFYQGTARFMSGRFITMMFGLLGAALAIYKCAKPEHKVRVGSLMFTAALTSFLTGITEPLEFAFLFVAPILYFIHAIFDGLAFMMAHIFNITIGQTFSGGFIDFILFGVLQGNAKTNWMMVPVIGSVWFVLYYCSFTYLIKLKDLKTPGREDENEAVINHVVGTERTNKIIEGLGGRENIKDIDCCATRLRISVLDADKVDESILKATGSRAVIIKGCGIQIVYGPQVTIIKTEIEEAVGC